MDGSDWIYPRTRCSELVLHIDPRHARESFNLLTSASSFKAEAQLLRWELFADAAVETESNPNQETTFLFITTELFLAIVKSSIHRS